jgi:hypothetical protein
VLDRKPCANLERMTQRSLMWYKDLPFSLIDWRKRLGEADTSINVDRAKFVGF